MKFSYNFSNICGAPFKGGKLCFTPDSSQVVVPSLNRVIMYHLKQNHVITLPFEARNNIKHILFSPIDPILITIDNKGRLLVVNSKKGVILRRLYLKKKVSIAKFSNCGHYIAIAIEKELMIWNSPSSESNWILTLNRVISCQSDKVVHISWTIDSSFICTSSLDTTVKIFSREPHNNFSPYIFSNHRYPLRGSFICKNNEYLYTISVNCTIIVYKFEEKCDETDIDLNTHVKEAKLLKGEWSLLSKNFCSPSPGEEVIQCDYNTTTDIIAIGFSNGVIGLYEGPDMNTLYTLSIGNDPLDTICWNPIGDWIALGSSFTGQLVVWEWRSETYILRQQAHSTGVRSVAISPVYDIQSFSSVTNERSYLGINNQSCIVASGDDIGKIKLWDTASGFNYVTFTEHTGSITDIVFSKQGTIILSSSDDGTVKAFDLIRFRNFRTFTAPIDCIQFKCVTIDSNGEIVVAGSSGAEFNVYIWSLQTGKLLDTLVGHEALISSVHFNPKPSQSGLLISTSWDATIRLWNIFKTVNKEVASDPLINCKGVLSCCFDPRQNNQLATSLHGGNIWFWDISKSMVVGTIDGIRDINYGREPNQKFSAIRMGTSTKGVNYNYHFDSIVYNSDGTLLLASSNRSSRICIYSTDKKILAYSISLTSNQCFDGIKVVLNSKLVNEAGIVEAELDLSDSDNDDSHAIQVAKRKIKHVESVGIEYSGIRSNTKKNLFNVWKLCFSQDGQQWCAATSHGLYSYSAKPMGLLFFNKNMNYISGSDLEYFSPLILTKNITSEKILSALHLYPSKAMLLALSMNDLKILSYVYLSIPYDAIPAVVQSIPAVLLPSFINLIQISFRIANMDASKIYFNSQLYLQRNLKWLTSLMCIHLANFQKLDPFMGTKKYIQSSDKSTLPENVLNELGISHVDLRSLFLLLLRNVQSVYSLLNNLYTTNIHILMALED